MKVDEAVAVISAGPKPRPFASSSSSRACLMLVALHNVAPRPPSEDVREDIEDVGAERGRERGMEAVNACNASNKRRRERQGERRLDQRLQLARRPPPQS